MQPNHASAVGGNRLPVPSTPDRLLFAVFRVAYDRERQLKFPTCGSLYAIAASQMGKTTS